MKKEKDKKSELPADTKFLIRHLGSSMHFEGQKSSMNEGEVRPFFTSKNKPHG
jgi:hypothetical protein